MILSCVTIAISVAVFALLINNPGYVLNNSTAEKVPLLDVFMNCVEYWYFPAIIALVLLSSLPRPRSRIERLPKIFGIVAVALSVSCSLFLSAMWTLFILSFVIDFGWLFF